jgi:pimeloyl-ACP methyl ester carboxylesterase
MLERFVILALVIAGIGIAICAITIFLMAQMLLHPRRMTDFRATLLLHRISPADLGMEFENVSLNVIDECKHEKLKIAGWWISTPDSRGKCAVILHGYSDAKVGAIAWAPLLRSFGFNILAIDLRAHGESGGAYSTGGFWERFDVNQVIDQIKAARPDETRQILLFGVSLGAAIAAATAVLRNDLFAVILEAPFANYVNAASLQGDRMGTPGPFFQKNAFRVAARLAKADFDAVRPTDTIPKISCPLMVIQCGDDPFLTDSDHAAIRQAVESRDRNLRPSICWDQPNVHHVIGMQLNPVEYHARIEEFLSGVLQNTPKVCDK